MRRSRLSLFPDHHTEGRDHRVRAVWNLDHPLPMPDDDHLVTCPVCAGPMVVKAWRLHVRQTGSAAPWRCDVRVKCVSCSLVFDYGVAVPQAMHQAAPSHGLTVGRWIEWRQGRAVLADAGYL